MANRSPGLPPGPRGFLEQGLAFHRRGDLVAAEKCYRAALAADREYTEALNLLATVQSQRKKPAEALASITRAIKLEPRRAEWRATLGSIHLAASRWEPARDAFAKAAHFAPRDPTVRFNLALTLERLGDLDGADREYRACLEIQPRNANAMCNLGKLLVQSGRAEEAVGLLERTVESEPGLAAAWVNLGLSCRETGRQTRAIECMRHAMGLVPRNSAMTTTLGQFLREAGDLAGAIEAFRTAIALDPENAPARIMLAMTRTCETRDSEFEWIEKLAHGIAPQGVRQSDVLFAYAKLLTDLGEDDAAFPILVQANATRRQTFQYQSGDIVERFGRIRATFDRELVGRLSGLGCNDATPIFVVGMPRSGTSLIEQVLAAHPEVFGAGETNHAHDIFDPTAFPGGHPDGFAGATPELLRATGERYLTLIRQRGVEASRIVDKMPMNFVRIGAIHAILPNAKIIHCVRDPRDTCVSIFEQNFGRDIPFAFDLEEIGQYFRLYDELMEHWRKVMPPGAFLDVRYEDVVDDLAGQTRRMLDYVGLPWDDACLDFHRTSRVVLTASLQQVRRPIYRTSLARWRRYGERLRPLFDALGRSKTATPRHRE